MRPGNPTAALAGVPAGIQAQGLWVGRRQLFVRFAAEAETATMYTTDALSNELAKSAARSVYHSISISGRDPLANIEYLLAAFKKTPAPLPVMLDCDGQRPEAIEAIAPHLALVQVTLDGLVPDAMVDHAMATLKAASTTTTDHALVLAPAEKMTDAQLFRVIERCREASDRTQIVIHPSAATTEQDRRWLTFMERAVSTHRDTRLLLKLPAPTGMR
jgi:organic radical activating enzyme